MVVLSRFGAPNLLDRAFTADQPKWKWALRMTIALRAPPRGRSFHSDRGSQYCSHDCRHILRDLGLQASMSGRGNCYDNAAVETFFKTIKAELICRQA